MKYYHYLIVFIFSFACAYIVNNMGYRIINSNIVDGTMYMPEFRNLDGDEIALIFITSPYCYFSNLAEMPQLIEKSKIRAMNIANDSQANFAAIGVVIVWDVNEGFEHISNFGQFDEIMIGRNWFNIGARKYIYADTTISKGSVPQLLIVSRKNEIKIKEDRSIYKIKEQNIIARYRGFDEIKLFAINN